MALFWTLAEGLILFYVRGGFLFFKEGKKRQKIFLIFCVTLFGLLILLLFGGEFFFGKIIDLRQDIHLMVYRWALWNFFCTLWVILEGVIMVYVHRIYKTLMPSLQKKDLTKEKSRPVKNGLTWGIPLLIFPLFALYLFYEYGLLSLLNKDLLDSRSIFPISSFYIRICGLFWILFEGVVAFFGIKTYLALKRMGVPIK
jgi:hypothetical protein